MRVKGKFVHIVANGKNIKTTDIQCLMGFFGTGSCKSWSSSQERIPVDWQVRVGYDCSHRRQHWHWSDCCWSLFVVKRFVRKLAQTYPPVTIRVYPYPCWWVRVYVGSAIPYPDPYPPNPYPRTCRVSKTLAQHYLWNIYINNSSWPNEQACNYCSIWL